MSILLVVALALPAGAMAGAADARGAAMAQACAACHGPNGHSQGAIPSIDNLSAEAAMAALKAFRTGERTGTVMNRIAKGLDDADISAVAHAFASQQRR
jgi:sulfide dehydrogenase cytochrome subunit